MSAPRQNPAYLQVPSPSASRQRNRSASLRASRSAQPFMMDSPPSPSPAPRLPSVHLSVNHRLPQLPISDTRHHGEDESLRRSSGRLSQTQQTRDIHSQYADFQELPTESSAHEDEPRPSRRRRGSPRISPSPLPVAADLPSDTPPRPPNPLPGGYHRTSLDDLRDEHEVGQEFGGASLEPPWNAEGGRQLRRMTSRGSVVSRVSFSGQEGTSDEDELPRFSPRHRSSHDLPSLLKPSEPPQPVRTGVMHMRGDGCTLNPVHNLRAYLASSVVEKFERWPEASRRRGLRWEPPGREYTHRLYATQERRTRRELWAWERDDTFADMVVDDADVHVPTTPLAKDDRWGEQRFTVPAAQFTTKPFRTMSLIVSRDRYLLQWLHNTVLTSALSALHAIRFRYTDAEFWYVPHPIPGKDNRGPPGLAEGYGSLVLARDGTGEASTFPAARRMLLLAVRPPWSHTREVLDAFASSSPNGWERQHFEVQDASGLANLLQAQMYDECVAHGVRHWVATTLKYWVFGVFSADYTRCDVSPPVRRDGGNGSRDGGCTVLECLVTWLRRALEAEELDQPERAVYHLPAVRRISRRLASRASGDGGNTSASSPAESTRLDLPPVAEWQRRSTSTSRSASRPRRRTTEPTSETDEPHTKTDTGTRTDERRQRRREREREREARERQRQRAQQTYAAGYGYVPSVQVYMPVGGVPQMTPPQARVQQYYYPQQWYG